MSTPQTSRELLEDFQRDASRLVAPPFSEGLTELERILLSSKRRPGVRAPVVYIGPTVSSATRPRFMLSAFLKRHPEQSISRLRTWLVGPDAQLAGYALTGLSAVASSAFEQLVESIEDRPEPVHVADGPFGWDYTLGEFGARLLSDSISKGQDA